MARTWGEEAKRGTGTTTAAFMHVRFDRWEIKPGDVPAARTVVLGKLRLLSVDRSRSRSFEAQTPTPAAYLPNVRNPRVRETCLLAPVGDKRVPCE